MFSRNALALNIYPKGKENLQNGALSNANEAKSFEEIKVL